MHFYTLRSTEPLATHLESPPFRTTVTLQLLDLPNELLVAIFLRLPTRNILACGASCNRLRAVITGSMLLQTRIWCTKHAIQRFLPSGLSPPNFMENAKKWENEWFQFKVGEEVATKLTPRSFQGSFFREYLRPTEYNFLLMSGYLIQMWQEENPGWSHIHLSLLPEPCKSIIYPDWTDVRLGDHFTMEGWALDIDHDLVAASLLSTGVPVGRLEIHLIHFTTGKCHKSAKIPMVQLEFKGDYDRLFGTHIEIMGNCLVILLAHGTFWRRYQTLYLVDWSKGHVVYQQRTSANKHFPVLTSISENTFVLGLRSDWALALCRITKEGDAITFRTLRKLQLPDVYRTTRVRLESFNKAPSVPDNAFVPKCHSTLPFRNSPSESVLSFYVKADRGWEHNILFFYVHPSALLALAERAVTAQVSGTKGLCHRFTRCTSLGPKTQAITVPWQQWGPKNTRWIESEGLSVRQSLSGTRCAISKWGGGGVKLLDFNPERVSLFAEHLASEEKVTGRVVNSPSTISARKSFKENIVSHLPYFEVVGEGAEGTVLIDDQWVVQVKLEWDQSLHDIHIIWVHSIEGSGSKIPQ